MAGHRTSTSLWLSDSYTCEFGFVCQWWLLFSSFQCGYVAFDLFFLFPKSNSASQYANDDWQRPTSIVDLTAREPCRIFTFAKHVSFEHSTGIPCPVISSRREGNIKQTDKTQKFLDTRSSISQSASTCPCSGAPRPVGDLAGAATFLSNRKYRYRPYTQPDVGNCWPWVDWSGGPLNRLWGVIRNWSIHILVLKSGESVCSCLIFIGQAECLVLVQTVVDKGEG